MHSFVPLRVVQSSFLQGRQSLSLSSRPFSSTSRTHSKRAPCRNLVGQGLMENGRCRLSISSLARQFSSASNRRAKNRIYTPVRRPDELQTYLLSSTSSQVPLITLWTASYCASCRIIAPLVNSLIASGVGESSSTSVNFCEVEFDSQDIMDGELGTQYMITSLPTLMTFDRGEVMSNSRTVDVNKMKNEKWLREWIEKEAQRKGEGSSGAGGIGLRNGGLFGGLFGNTKS